MKKKPVRFIRVKGRVVPIFEKKRKEGIAAIIGGGTLAFGGGAISGKLLKAAIKAENKAALASTFSIHSFMNPPKKAAKTISKLRRSETLLKLSAKSFSLARTGSAIALGFGVKKLTESFAIKNQDFLESGIPELAGIGSAVVAERGSAAFQKKFGHGIKFKDQFGMMKGPSKRTVSLLKKAGKYLLRKKGIKL